MAPLKHMLIYGAAFAGLAFIVALLSAAYATPGPSRHIPIFGLAALFMALGIWLGWRVKPQRGLAFEKNEAALKSLGLTRQEFRVLEFINAGKTNKEIARDMGISPNTVKSHMARLYEKLGVNSRTQAVKFARQLELIP